eukprot:TRINITY_DN7346_c0_g5_i1.p1 TRINITY_DN7346_c0_g5~~TRINITY_DN7346_c0_g5_i1.p1  ORF type:complete len:114 (-),score=25.96 TRINITY_DN7346_c0_g5_i1:453-794(-)
MDQPFMGLIHQDLGDQQLGLFSKEVPPLDLFPEENPPLDLVPSLLKASCGTCMEDPTSGRPTGDELVRDSHEDLKKTGPKGSKKGRPTTQSQVHTGIHAHHQRHESPRKIFLP